MLLLLSLPAFAAPTCKTTQSLTALEGTFTDGSKESAQYKDGQSVCWKVAPSCPDEGRVTLWFERMELEARYDFVQVFDASGRLTSKSASKEMTFYGDSFTVWFSTDESTTDVGFTARYSCESLEEGEEDRIGDAEE